jgi:hypothetical protein
MRTKQAARASVAAAVAVSLTAATALAVPPPPSSSFSGSTTQTKVKHHKASLKTDANGHVSRLSIDWRGKCKQKGKFWTARTVVQGGSDGVPMTGDTFGETGTYTSNAGAGVTGFVSVTFSGHFTDADNARGKWKANVKVMKKGKQIDSCSAKLKWSVKRKA